MPTLRRDRQVDLCERDQPGLHIVSSRTYSQSYVDTNSINKETLGLCEVGSKQGAYMYLYNIGQSDSNQSINQKLINRRNPFSTTF